MALIRLSKEAYFNNIDEISKKSGGKDRVILVLKDNAYGHGAKEIGSLAKSSGIKKCAVKNEDEARELSQFFPWILILSHRPTGKEDPRFIYAINDFSQINKLAPHTKVHLALDSLMHRNGITKDELKPALKLISEQQLELIGAYTHYRAADEFSADFYVQRKSYLELKEFLREEASKFGYSLCFHSQNTAALQRLDLLDDDFIRVGMAQFGYKQLNHNSLNLKIVLKLYANKISQRVLQKGQRVGYGGVFQADEEMMIATYDLGYGDGLFRCKLAKNPLLQNGENILGKMSMDSFVAKDLGDEVCVIDDARVWAKAFDTIEYEILVKLSSKIERVIV